MKTISRSDIPTDFTYYRTGSRVFYDYYRTYVQSIIVRIGEWYQFIKAGKLFGSFYSIIAEKVDIEPTSDMMKKLGMLHGIIFWWPMRIIEKPRWWWRIPRFLVQYFELLHSTRSAFSILARPDYWEKWSPSARAHRRKTLEYIRVWKVRIEQIYDIQTYIDIYRGIRVPDPHKSYLIRWCEKNFSTRKEDIRIYVAYIDDIPLAWAIFIDEGVTSEYFTSFYARESHPYHLGIAMMDRWFLDSYAKSIKYCDLDHIRDSLQSPRYRWYTRFKESIADHDVYFHDLWIKIF
jgi:hypothetical protein